MEEANNRMIREIFSILTQGVEMVQYEVSQQTQRSKTSKKIVWMDSDIYRICVDTVRPSMADRATGKIPPGIYLRDISEVKPGADAYDFAKNRTRPTDPSRCLTLIGSERSISLELPSAFTREWFFDRFRLLADDILVEQEQKFRKYKIWENFHSLSQDESANARALEGLLSDRGIQINFHNRAGYIVKSVLKFDRASLTLELHTNKKTYLNMWAPAVLRIHVNDVSEIRPGSHSLGFVKTGSTEFDTENLSIVGSENVFDMQLINETARNLLAERLFQLVLYHKNDATLKLGADGAPSQLSQTQHALMNNDDDI